MSTCSAIAQHVSTPPNRQADVCTARRVSRLFLGICCGPDEIVGESDMGRAASKIITVDEALKRCTSTPACCVICSLPGAICGELRCIAAAGCC